jgi:hypothetical protein
MPAFDGADDVTVFAARAEVAQGLRWAGLELRFHALPRTADLFVGQERHRVDLIVKPDLSRAIRDPKTGRFTGPRGD